MSTSRANALAVKPEASIAARSNLIRASMHDILGAYTPRGNSLTCKVFVRLLERIRKEGGRSCGFRGNARILHDMERRSFLGALAAIIAVPKALLALPAKIPQGVHFGGKPDSRVRYGTREYELTISPEAFDAKSMVVGKSFTVEATGYPIKNGSYELTRVVHEDIFVRLSLRPVVRG